MAFSLQKGVKTCENQIALFRANQALLVLCRKTREKTMTIALRVWRNSSCGPPRRRTRPDPSGQWISPATNQKKPPVKRLATSRNSAFQLGFQETVCFMRVSCRNRTPGDLKISASLQGGKHNKTPSAIDASDLGESENGALAIPWPCW